MRLYFLAFLGLVLLALLYKKFMEPGKFTFSIILCLALLGGNGYMEYKWDETQKRANDVVNMIAGKKSGRLHCQRLSETMVFVGQEVGSVQSNADGSLTGMLSYQLCHDFEYWIDSDKSKIDEVTATNLHVIVHESYHLTGLFNEAETECKAMSSDAKVFAKLGAPKTVADALAKLYHDKVYPKLTLEYNNLKC